MCLKAKRKLLPNVATHWQLAALIQTVLHQRWGGKIIKESDGVSTLNREEDIRDRIYLAILHFSENRVSLNQTGRSSPTDKFLGTKLYALQEALAHMRGRRLDFWPVVLTLFIRTQCQLFSQEL